MKIRPKVLWSILKETFKEWNNDEPYRLSAIIAYYAILSLPGMMVIVIRIAGSLFSEETVQNEIFSQVNAMMGQDAAKSVRTMVENASEGGGSLFATILGIGALVFGATTMFFHLQQSLNKIWGVKADPKFAGWKKLILDRVLSFGLVLVVAFLLLISLVLSAALAAISTWITDILPYYTIYVFHIVNFLLSFGIITLLFALIYKFLPDVEIHWRDVWIGAAVTALLFVIGKTLLGFYFGQANPGSTYGAAGSVILILLWVSYSCWILFFGAEFTQVFSRRYGAKILPSSHAVKVVTYEEELYGKDVDASKNYDTKDRSQEVQKDEGS